MVSQTAERVLSRTIDWGLIDRLLLGRGEREQSENIPFATVALTFPAGPFYISVLEPSFPNSRSAHLHGVSENGRIFTS